MPLSCPVNHDEDIDKANLIPVDLEKSNTEIKGLSAKRVQSSIPRSEAPSTDGESSACPVKTKENTMNWMYPSETMFYSAMARKGNRPNPHDMELVVNIHNMVNEQCWVEILKWEQMHKAYIHIVFSTNLIF